MSRSTLDLSCLYATAKEEPHLLTAILTISSKDVVEEPKVHEVCFRYMQRLIAEIVAGKLCTVEAVEAFLLLAQWPPRRIDLDGFGGTGEEDRAAWMYIGMAIRLGYFLGLESASFAREGDPNFDLLRRRRLAWSGLFLYPPT